VKAASKQRRRSTWTAYAAFAWSFVFALMSFYWGMGGKLGLNTLAQSIQYLSQKSISIFWLRGLFFWVRVVCNDVSPLGFFMTR
jgi:hypothetical protein